MRPMHPSAGRTIEQDRVGFCFPNCSQLDGSWPVQAEVDAARFASAKQNSLGDIENIDLQFVVFADSLVNVPT